MWFEANVECSLDLRLNPLYEVQYTECLACDDAIDDHKPDISSTSLFELIELHHGNWRSKAQIPLHARDVPQSEVVCSVKCGKPLHIKIYEGCLWSISLTILQLCPFS